MKKVFLTLFALFIFGIIFAQSPKSFNYQAVLRDASGSVNANSDVNVELSIIQGSIDGTSVYTESHSVTTNEFGLINLAIGSIKPDDFATIDWSSGPYFVKVSVSGTEFGTSQLLSVPYAMYADKAGNTFSGKFTDLTDVPSNLDTNSTDDFDGSYSKLSGTPSDLSAFNNDVGYLTQDTTLSEEEVDAFVSDNGYLKVEVDGSLSNELQVLSFSNDTLTLSDGNFVVLPYAQETWSRSNDTIYYNTGPIGIGTSSPSASVDIGSKTDGIVIPKGITGERPSTPVTGTMRYNTSLSQPEYYDGNQWIGLSPPKGVGGIVTEVGGYRIHTFLTSGTFTAKMAMNVDVLIVGGGGSGGSNNTTNANGGGGGGGVIYKTDHTISPGEYPVIVGKGGAGIGHKMISQGRNGENSVFDTLTAIGGGGGGSTGDGQGLDGGSGGGGAYNYPSGGASTQGAGGFGNSGGGGNQNYTGGGGGGAGSAGVDGNADPGNFPSGNGGAGYACSISGTQKYYGGGGGGGANSAERAGDGFDGGGRGFGTTSFYSNTEWYAGEINPITRGSASVDAIPNTGGGGGGNSYYSDYVGWYTGSGKGGSGIVIIRYPIAQ